MIVDTSALVAILRQEPEAASFARAIRDALIARVSAGTLLEAMIVVDTSADTSARSRLDELVSEADLVIEPVTAEQAAIGRQAYRDFGKGSRHPAQLNFGDCFAYALAKVTGEPLLFKGDDFGHTDVLGAV